MKKKMLILGCILLGLTTSSIQAQDQASVSPSSSNTQADSTHLSLSLADAQEYAVAHNRTLKNASLDIQKAEASRWQTLASMLPQVSAAFDYSSYCGYEMAFGGMSVPMNPSGTLGVTAAVALSGAQIVGVQLSDISIKMSDISYRQTEQQLRDQVKTLYYSALVMEQTVKLLDNNMVNMNDLYKYTEAAVKVGVSEQTDADQLAVQLASMQTNISSSKRSLEMIYNSIRLQLGLDVQSEITLTQGISDLLNIDAIVQLLSEEFVLDNNYNYQLLKQSTQLSHKQVEMAQWKYGPTVSAYYQYSAKTYFGKDEGFNMTPPNMIGASVKIPIFSSGSTLKAVQEAKINHEEQMNTLADTEESLKIQHRQLCYNLSTAFETYDTQKKNIDVIQRVFDNISNKYKYGAASSLDITNAGTNLISAQSSYVQALLELVNAQIAIEQLLNK